ncbi:MAG: cobalamin B12-binding domain-containing protein [Eubacteriales bacterium]
MSHLFQNSNQKVNNLAVKVFDRQFELDKKLNLEYDERRKVLMFEDILYNLGYLDTAMALDEEKIFTEYAVWIYHLMCHLMKDLSRERLRDQMVLHYEILKESLTESLDPEQAQKARYHLDNAIEATKEEAIHYNISNRFELGNYADIRKEYLDLLLKNDTRGAINLIEQASKSGIKLDEIFIDIMQEVMYEVGNLWHQNIITVDKEHYCTSMTQVILSRFYPEIFSTPRNGRKILACCVGSELHEMGVRMVSDLFEYNGWNSIYLGSAVPKAAILHAIEENQPDLVALSVTMPQHLPLCLEIVNAIREKFSDIKIAVGGKAFQNTNELWKKWNVDISTDNAAQLVEWAELNIINKGKCKNE